MRTILSAMTRNRFSGVATGVLITALIQSSSASTVMVVSFVNAGLMSLQQSMAVIMGANVGTTFTAWIIAIFGVKVNVGALAVPFIAVAVLLLFSKSSRSKSIGEFIIGFSFLFMGLGMISANVPELDANTLEFLADYSNHGFASVLLFIFVGLVITMIIQSSAATFAIVLVMSTKGWIGFDMACAAVLGSNIGTTITPVLASLSANQTAKKAALGHFLFNLFGTGGLPLTDDLFLAALAGGALMALGIGLVFRGGGTTGGSDIVTKFLRLKYKHVKTGSVFLAVDSVVVVLSAIIFHDIEVALYAALSLVVSATVLDRVLYGTDEAKLVYIISDKGDEIADVLMSRLDVGVTYLEGQGAYTGNDKKVLMCAAHKRAFPRIREVVTDVDDVAFMIVSSAQEIFGEGFKNHRSGDL